MCILAFQISPVLHASDVCFECVTTKFRLKSDLKMPATVQQWRQTLKATLHTRPISHSWKVLDD